MFVFISKNQKNPLKTFARRIGPNVKRGGGEEGKPQQCLARATSKSSSFNYCVLKFLLQYFMYTLTILARLYGLTWSDYIYALTWSDYIYALTWSDSLKIVLSWRNNIGRTRISRWLRLGIVVAGLPPLLGGNFDPLYCPSVLFPIRYTAHPAYCNI